MFKNFQNPGSVNQTQIIFDPQVIKALLTLKTNHYESKIHKCHLCRAHWPLNNYNVCDVMKHMRDKYRDVEPIK